MVSELFSQRLPQGLDEVEWGVVRWGRRGVGLGRKGESQPGVALGRSTGDFGTLP